MWGARCAPGHQAQLVSAQGPDLLLLVLSLKIITAVITMHYCCCCCGQDVPVPCILTGPCWFDPWWGHIGYLMQRIY